MTDVEHVHERILREVFAQMKPRVRRGVKAHDHAMVDVAVQAALTRAILLGVQHGEAMEAERLNAKWTAAVEQTFGQTVDLEYQPPAPIEVPDAWTALYGS